MTAREMTEDLIFKNDFFRRYKYDEFVDICQIERYLIEGKKRHRPIIIHRSLAQVLAYIELNSLTAAGKRTGHDHASVLNSLRNVYNGIMMNDSLFLNAIERFKRDAQKHEMAGDIKLSNALLILENQFNNQK